MAKLNDRNILRIIRIAFNTGQYGPVSEASWRSGLSGFRFDAQLAPLCPACFAVLTHGREVGLAHGHGVEALFHEGP
ncbi:MAG: hypothetical protein OXU72_11585 [Gammaproteobacteria bacterium]|nr:hypothetical protein [Gammaproteobacteria bacterium]